MRERRFFILRIFFMFASILLGLSLIRFLLSGEPLRFSYLLELISKIDLDFSSTIYRIGVIGRDFGTLGDVSWWNAIIQFLRGIYHAVTLPIEIVLDLLAFMWSCVELIISILGVNVWISS